MYKIKNLNLKNRFFLAPMAEVNDLAFRLLCKKAGASLVYTGMINPLTQKDLTKELKDKPAIQLFSTSEKGIKEFMKKYDSQASLWDFNLGCPSKVAQKLKFGSFMHNKLDDIEKILKEMRKSTKKPITIKLRKSKQAIKILKIANKYCDAICIHPRTKEQGYSGTPDLEFALQVKKRTKLPIIYSGNVNKENYKELLNKFDFLMIGRVALGNPQIFSELTNKKTNLNFADVRKEFSEHPKIPNNKQGFFDYLKLAKENNLYFRNIKTQAMYFTKNNLQAKELRRKIAKAKNLQEINQIMQNN